MHLYGDVLRGRGLWRRRTSANGRLSMEFIKKMCYGARWTDWTNLFNI